MRPTFSQIRSLGDPAINNTWFIQFTNIPSAAGVSSDDLNFRAESVDIPKMEGSKVEVQIRGLPPVKYPGTFKPNGSITITLFETEDNKVTKAIQALQELNFNTETGAGVLKQDLTFGVRIARLNRQNKPIWEYELQGAFLESYEPGGQLEGGDASILKPTMTLSFDSFTQKAL